MLLARRSRSASVSSAQSADENAHSSVQRQGLHHLKPSKTTTSLRTIPQPAPVNLSAIQPAADSLDKAERIPTAETDLHFITATLQHQHLSVFHVESTTTFSQLADALSARVATAAKEFLAACIEIQRIIDLYNNNNNKSVRSAISFGHGFLDTSSVFPPHMQVAEPAEQICRALVNAHVAALKLSPQDAQNLVNGFVDNANKCDMFVAALQAVMIREASTSDEAGEQGPFACELADRLSSVIRFHLRQAVNPFKTFAVLQLGGVVSNSPKLPLVPSEPAGPDVVAHILHQALCVINDYDSEETLADGLAEYKGARSFVTQLMSAMDVVVALDQRRAKHWASAQTWAEQARQLLSTLPPGGLEGLSLMSDPDFLLAECQSNAKKNENAPLKRLLAMQPHSRLGAASMMVASAAGGGASQLRAMRGAMRSTRVFVFPTSVKSLLVP
jgi:hypothetical protein